MEQRASRGRRAMSWVSLALGVLLAIIVVSYLFLRTDFFAGAAGRLVTKHLFGGQPFTVSIDNFEGSIVRDVTLRNLRITYRGGAASAFELFRADEVTCRFSIGSALGAGHRVDEIIIVNPVLRLAADSTGRYVLPSFGSGGFSTYGIERFSIHDGSLAVRGDGEGMDVAEVNLSGSMRSGAEGVRIALSRGSAVESSRRFVVRSLSGEFGYTRVRARGGSGEATSTKYLLDSLAVSLEQSFLVLDGSVVEDGRLINVVARAAPLDIDEIARLAGREGGGWGEVEGVFTLVGPPERLRVWGVADGAVRGYALEEFRFDAMRDGGTIEIADVSGRVNGALLSGRGSVGIEAPRTVELALDVEHLDISRGFLPGADLPASDFTGAVDVSCRLDPLDASFMLDLGGGQFRGVPFAEAWVRGSYGADTLRFAEIDLSHPEHRVSANGFIFDGETISFIMNAEVESTSPLFAYFDIEPYRTDASLNGIVEGTFDEFDLRMSGEARDFEYYGTLLSTGAVRLAIEKRERYRVLCDVDGLLYRVGPFAFDSLALSLEYEDPLTRIKNLSLAGRDLSASMTADIGNERDGATIRIGDCELGALGERWVAAGGRTIAIAGDTARFEDVQFHSREGAVIADLAWGFGGETLDGTVRFDRLTLGLLGRAGIAPLPLDGRIRGAATCAGPLSDPALSVRCELEDGRVDTFAVDAARLIASYGAGRLRIDSLEIASPSGGLSLDGEIAGVSFRDALRGRREATASAVVSLEAVCSDLKAAPLLSLARVPGITAGRLDGVLSVRDSLVHPIVEFRGAVRDLARGSLSVPEIDCELRLDRRSIEAEGILVLSSEHRGSFRGSFPVAPASFLYSLDRTRSLSLAVDIPEGDFAEVLSLTNRVAEASGRYAVKFGVTGTVDDPHLTGEATIRDASLRIAGMEERYTALNASIGIADSLVTIARLDAKRGKKGSVSAGGTIALSGWKPARYDLSAKLSRFTIESFADMTAVVTGTLRATTASVDGRIVPNVTGACTVDRADIYYDTAKIGSGDGGPTIAAPSFVAAVDLHIPGETRVRTDDAQIELRGDVTLHHDRGGTYFRGDIDLVRGWYNLYNNKFNMRSGQFRFIVAGSARPVVDIEAETRDPEGRRIYLTIAWHQDDQEPRLTLSHEDAGYSETDIWVMLGGGVVDGEGDAGASWNARGTAQNLATNYLERVLNAQMQGVTIELESPASASSESGTAGWTDTKIAVGKYLSQGLYVKYKQALSISTAREFEVEYRLSDLILLRSQLIRYSEQVLSGKSSNTSDEINVDVKLRWEF